MVGTVSIFTAIAFGVCVCVCVCVSCKFDEAFGVCVCVLVSLLPSSLLLHIARYRRKT
jgi:hypothetical protein